MSAKTRIVVLHMKKLVFAGVITGLGILLVIFLGILLGSSHKQSATKRWKPCTFRVSIPLLS